MNDEPTRPAFEIRRARPVAGPGIDHPAIPASEEMELKQRELDQEFQSKTESEPVRSGRHANRKVGSTKTRKPDTNADVISAAGEALTTPPRLSLTTKERNALFKIMEHLRPLSTAGSARVLAAVNYLLG